MMPFRDQPRPATTLPPSPEAPGEVRQNSANRIDTYPAIMTGLQKIDVTEGRFGVVVKMVRCWSFTSEKLGLAQKMTKHFNLKLLKCGLQCSISISYHCNEKCNGGPKLRVCQLAIGRTTGWVQLCKGFFRGPLPSNSFDI